MSFRAVHRFAKPGIGSVNTYWLETAEGLIVIDGQREISAAQDARSQMAQLNKPVLAVLLTHPHPDHFGGIGVFSPPDSAIRIYASAQTRESIRQDRWQLVKASKELLGQDFPAEVRLPTHLLSDNQPIEVGNVEIIPAEMGGGEAECMTVLYLPEQRILFSGDLVQNRMTAYLLEGRSRAWLGQLRTLLTRFPYSEMLYPGHGEPGQTHDLVEAQIRYLEDFQTISGSGRAINAVVAEMEQKFPGYVPVASIPDLLHRNATALARELL